MQPWSYIRYHQTRLSQSKLSSPVVGPAGPEASFPSTNSSDSVSRKVISLNIGLYTKPREKKTTQNRKSNIDIQRPLRTRKSSGLCWRLLEWGKVLSHRWPAFKKAPLGGGFSINYLTWMKKDRTLLYIKNFQSSPLLCTRRVRQGGDTKQSKGCKQGIRPIGLKQGSKKRDKR